MTTVTSTQVEKAHAAHGPTVPDWILELARYADHYGLKGASARIKYARSTISQVIGGTYRGDMKRVEECVRGALMGVTVDCPVIGDLARDKCLDWQNKPFDATNSHRVRMFHACRRGCPHSKFTKETADAV